MQKNKNIKVLAIFILIANMVSAQIFSPYSQYGLGIVHTNQSAVTGAMGGVSAAYSDPYNINYTNPAALADIRFTSLDIGLRLNTRSITANSALPFTVADGGINNVSFSFPVMKDRWGMSFGLLPYSFSKYKYTTNQTFNDIDYLTEVEGTGSLYKLYFANGVKWKGLKAGVNAEFIFGKFSNTYYNEFSDNNNETGSRLNRTMSLRDVVFNFGAQYNFILTKFEKREKNKANLEMTVGAYFAPSLAVDAYVSEYLEATKLSSINSEPYPIDTASGSFFQKYSSVAAPMNLGVGLNIGKKDKWNIGLDYDFKSWTATNSPIQSSQLTDEWHIKIGGEITPDYKSKKYLSRVTYRVGGHYGKAPFLHENTEVSDFGITFGFGIPFARYKYTNKSLSNLNIAFEIGALGANKNQSLTENYYNLTLTYTLSDIWFRKQKFD
jgi:hypothetical protein